MPIIFAVDDGGQSYVEIADADAEVHTYRWRIIDADFDLWALLLTRTDTDLTYRVAELAPGRWTCSCKAFKYRKRGEPFCKHCDAARCLRAFLRQLNLEMETCLNIA